MYSKYSGFSIPQNYSGSRFSPASEPQTKTHRGEVGGATRHAHSPTFVSQNAEPEELYDEQDFIAQENPLNDIVEMLTPNEPQEIFSEEDTASDVNNEPFIEKLFRSLDKDQLLILALIILLMTDGDEKNNDIVFLLAILLLS